MTDLHGDDPRDETAYGITDLADTEADAGRIGSLVRNHWGIETRLHYVRDVTYNEDHSQVRTGNAPRTMATLRNIAIGLLRRMKLPNIARSVAYLDHHPEQVAALLGC